MAGPVRTIHKEEKLQELEEKARNTADLIMSQIFHVQNLIKRLRKRRRVMTEREKLEAVEEIDSMFRALQSMVEPLASQVRIKSEIEGIRRKYSSLNKTWNWNHYWNYSYAMAAELFGLAARTIGFTGATSEQSYYEYLIEMAKYRSPSLHEFVYADAEDGAVLLREVTGDD